MKSPRLIARQKASLAALATKAGLDVDELERRLLQNLVTSHISHSRNLERVDGALNTSRAREDFDQKINRCSNYWECLDLFEPLLHKLNVLVLARHARTIPIAWQYLDRLSQRHSLPCPGQDADAFERFLTAIPACYLFTHEFNAFLEQSGHDQEPPAVYYYFLLQHTLTECAKIFACYWEVQVSPETFPQSVRLPTKDDFENEIRRLLSILLGETLFAPRFLTEELGGAAYVGCASMEMSSLLFVACHEYGHLLLGHLDRAHAKVLEHEADLFAMRVISDFRIPNREFGIAAVFVILGILENIYTPGGSHPTALERLSAVAQQAQQLGFEVGQFEYAASVLRDLFNAAVQERFGRRVFQAAET